MTDDSHRPTQFCRLKWFLAALILVFLSNSNAGAEECVRWIQRTNVGSYGQRVHHAMAYDEDRGVIVFFGGEIGKGGSESFFGDTQEYDGTNWVRIGIRGSAPQERSMHAMTYDPVRKRVMMYGGRNARNPGLSDCWVYEREGAAGAWKYLGDVLPTVGAGMVWNPIRQGLMIYGGFNEITDPRGGFAIAMGFVGWDGDSWQLNAGGTEPSVYGHAMAWDPVRQAAMLYGGFRAADESLPIDSTWELGSQPLWIQQTTGPSARGYAAMAYDERRERMVLVGGAGESPEVGEEVYEYEPLARKWIAGSRLPAGMGRAGAKMVYDRRRQVLVLTGGAGGGAPNGGSGGRYSDTWELVPGLFIAGQPSNVDAAACSDAQLRVEAQGRAPLRFTWRRDGNPILEDDRIQGVGSSTLSLRQIRHADAGEYDVVISDTCQPMTVVTSRVARLAVSPQAEWGLRAVQGPSPRFAHSMAYDSRRGVTLMFGGRTNWNHMVPFGDLWEWDGATWSLRMQENNSDGWVFATGQGWKPSYNHQPVRRAHAAMAYDSRRGRTVLFGGESLNPDGGFVILRDLWEWDGARWHFVGAFGPLGRIGASMTYDERRERCVLFGGQPEVPSGETSDADWVWEWDGRAWLGIIPTLENRVPSGTGYRTQARMAYDAERGVVVMGPTVESFSAFAFWEWDGDRWKAAPVLDPHDPVLPLINGISNGALVYDTDRRRSVWFGGYGLQTKDLTLQFDGKAWVLFTPASIPKARTHAAAVYDTRRGVTVLFGGVEASFGTSGELGDTWEYSAPDLPVILEQPLSQYVKEGTLVTFKVRVQSSADAPLSYDWYRGNARVDEATQQRITGASTAELQIRNAVLQDADVYRVRVSNRCGAVWSLYAQLTLNPQLQLFPKTSPMSLVWEEQPTRLLESATRPEGPWTPVPNARSPHTLSGQEQGQFFRLREIAP